MHLSNRAKIMLLLAAVLVVLYLMSKSSKEPINNEGALSYDPEESATEERSNTESDNATNTEEAVSANDLLKKMKGDNSEEYKRSNYRNGSRGGSSGDLDKFFSEGDAFDKNTNDAYQANDETNGQFASYVSNGKRPQNEEDKFNSGDLLPKENNADWFEDVHAVGVKNRHLINIYRPIGVNTVSTTLKNASHDLRGTINNPKTFVSPFLNSSIEPDHNIKGLC